MTFVEVVHVSGHISGLEVHNVVGLRGGREGGREGG